MKLTLTFLILVLLALILDSTCDQTKRRCRKCRKGQRKRDGERHQRKHGREKKHLSVPENAKAIELESQNYSEQFDEKWLVYLESRPRPSPLPTAHPKKNETNEYTEALVDILLNLEEDGSAMLKNYTNRKGVHISTQKIIGKFGFHSPRISVFGEVIHVLDDEVLNTHSGCLADMANKEDIPASGRPWIALISRGLCTFATKIKLAEEFNASAVVVYDNDPNGDVEVMSTPGTEVPSLMIKERYGKGVSRLLDKGQPMYMNITVGKTHNWETQQSTVENPDSGSGISKSSNGLLVVCLLVLLSWHV